MDIHVESIEIDTNAVESKVNALLDENTLTKMQAAFALIIDPWTPFLTGQLHSSIDIDSSGVTYEVPYAREKYYGEVYTKTHHPLATSHWDRVALQTEMETLENEVRNILIERVKELYG